MTIKGGGGEAVVDQDFGVVSDLNRRRREHLRVELVELTRILVAPKSKARHAPDHDKGTMKCLNHLLTTEAITAQ